MIKRWVGVFVCFFLVSSLAGASKTVAPKALATTNESYICIETSTGIVIAEQNADVVRPPASMVKMIEMLIVAEGLEGGLWTLDKPLTITKEVELINGSQAYLKAGEVFTLGDLMSAVAVCSANDAAAAVAEGLFGSIDQYLMVANARAQQLGMADTVFRTPNGLPPVPGELPDQTTARDMAILAMQCIQHPTVMQWVGQKELTLRPGRGTHQNTNKLLWQMAGCDGLKTGFTNAAGWCLTATAERDGIRLISVIMGCENKSSRFSYAQQILENGFASVSRQRVIAKGQRLDPPIQVANCSTPAVYLTAAADVWAIVPKTSEQSLEVVAQRPTVIQAPINAGTIIGTVEVKLAGRTLSSAALTVPETLESAGWKWKMQESVRRTGERLRRSRQPVR